MTRYWDPIVFLFGYVLGVCLDFLQLDVGPKDEGRDVIPVSWCFELALAKLQDKTLVCSVFLTNGQGSAGPVLDPAV